IWQRPRLPPPGLSSILFETRRASMTSKTMEQLKAIRPKQVRSAIAELRRDGYPPAHKSKEYHLVYEDELYPQKYVASIATRYANGTQLLPSEFSATQSLQVLRALGFEIRTDVSARDGQDGRTPVGGEVVGD